MKKVWNYFKENPIVAILLMATVVMSVSVENFASWGNMGNLISNTTVRFIMALGVSGCLITKGTDLSAGRQMGLAACITGILMQRADYAGRVSPFGEMNMAVVLGIVLAVGAIIGYLNGTVISRLHVPPFIATLGTQTIIYSICLVTTNAQPIGGFQAKYIDLINGRIGQSVKQFHIPYLFFVALFVGLLFWFMYNKTRHGKYMYAIGGNEVAAEVSGVNTGRTLRMIYMTAGIMYALAGYLIAAKAGGASSGLGSGYELEAIAGCTIGGVSTTGGIGKVSGVLIGVLVFELLKIILQFLGVNPNYNYAVQGIVIIVSVALDIKKYVQKK